MTTLKDSLKIFMESKKLNASQLARSTGIKQPVIHRILTGDTLDPKIGTVSALANFFQVSINELVGQQKILENKIPLLTLENIQEYLTGQLHPTEYFNISEKESNKSIALKISDSTMLPRFPKDTVIIIDPKLNAKDRSYVIVFIVEKNISLFRQLLLDGNDTYIKPLNPDFPLLKLSSQFKIVGVVTQAQMNLGNSDEIF